MSAEPRSSLDLLDRRLWRRHYFIPTEHGAWIWWIGPFLIGTAAGGKVSVDVLVLILAVGAAFFLRQPAAIAVKALSGRRPRNDLAKLRLKPTSHLPHAVLKSRLVGGGRAYV